MYSEVTPYTSAHLSRSHGFAVPLWKQLVHKVYFSRSIDANLPDDLRPQSIRVSQFSNRAYGSTRRKSSVAFPELIQRKQNVEELYTQRIPRVHTASARRPRTAKYTQIKQNRDRVLSAKRPEKQVAKDSSNDQPGLIVPGPVIKKKSSNKDKITNKDDKLVATKEPPTDIGTITHEEEDLDLQSIQEEVREDGTKEMPRLLRINHSIDWTDLTTHRVVH